jgi:hypothetical protein
MAVYYATNALTGNIVAAALTGQIVQRHPCIVADGAGDVITECATISFASGVNPVINDVIELGVLPADHVPIDWMLIGDDFDSATGVTIAIGIMAGTVGDTTRVYTDVGVEALASGSTTLQAAAFLRNVSVTWGRVAPTSGDRSIGLTFAAAPTTNPSTTRRLDFIYSYRWSRYGR